jgi:hypothetical protein
MKGKHLRVSGVVMLEPCIKYRVNSAKHLRVSGVVMLERSEASQGGGH